MEGDTLFSYQTDFDDEVVNTLLKNLTTDSDQISELGKTPIKTKYTGIVDDIVIYRTCETDEMSPSLKKFVGQYESKVLKTKKRIKKLWKNIYWKREIPGIFLLNLQSRPNSYII